MLHVLPAGRASRLSQLLSRFSYRLMRDRLRDIFGGNRRNRFGRHIMFGGRTAWASR